MSGSALAAGSDQALPVASAIPLTELNAVQLTVELELIGQFVVVRQHVCLGQLDVVR